MNKFTTELTQAGVDKTLEFHVTHNDTGFKMVFYADVEVTQRIAFVAINILADPSTSMITGPIAQEYFNTVLVRELSIFNLQRVRVTQVNYNQHTGGYLS